CRNPLSPLPGGNPRRSPPVSWPTGLRRLRPPGFGGEGSSPPSPESRRATSPAARPYPPAPSSGRSTAEACGNCAPPPHPPPRTEKGPLEPVIFREPMLRPPVRENYLTKKKKVRKSC